MKIRTLLACAVCLFPLRTSFAQNSVEPPLMSVSGSGEVKVVPDEILLNVGVESRHENLEQATQKNNASVSKTLAFLKKSGVKEKDVQTDFISIEPIYDTNISQTKPVAYIVRKTLQVKLTKIDAFEGVLAGLLTTGVNNVQGIEFHTSQLRKHRDTARAMAIRAAREKADALAAELGVKRGRVYSVNANDGGGWWNAGGGWGAKYGRAMFQNAVQSSGGAADSEGSSLSIGQISVSASVNVSYVIE